MQSVTNEYSSAINAPLRQMYAKIGVFIGDTQLASLDNNDIISIEIQRTGEQSKFFGFGISHKATIKLTDKDRKRVYNPFCSFEVSLGIEIDGVEKAFKFPRFYYDGATRDEKTNEVTIIAYDLLHQATLHTTGELDIIAPYTLLDYANTTADFLDGQHRMPTPNVLTPFKEEAAKDGITYNPTDGTITVNGTFSAATRYILDADVEFPEGVEPYITIPADTYECQLKVLGGTASNNSAYFKIDWVNGSSYTTRLTSTTFKVSTNVASIYVVIPAGTYTNYVIQPSISGLQLLVPLFENSSENPALELSYENGANFEGTETLRDALTAIAEATQTIYYVTSDNVLTFKQMNTDGTIHKRITKDIYMDLKGGNIRSLQSICSATELGDNITATYSYDVGDGKTQYVRNNPFWELRDDITTILDNALAQIEGVEFNEFEIEWRGDPALEPGDKIAYETKDGDFGYSYLINDTITYNGGLRQKTEWNYTGGEETFSNPSSLGEVIKQTYAKVDKQNKEISLVAGEASENRQEVAALKINTESISASVSKMEEASSDAIASINGELATITKKVEATMTAEDVQLQIKSEISNGVDKVTTATGFTFNEEGLTIAKTGSEMTTNIDEDGMSVFRDNEEVLTADNTGVTAYNLKARTYLIVGENSRFEDFTSADGETRTGCFWIGG